MDEPGQVANPARGGLNREKRIICLCPRLRLRMMWSRETDLAAPSRVVSLLVLHIEVEIWCLLAEFLPLSAKSCIYLYRQPPSGQFRVYISKIPQIMAIDGLQCQESAGTGPVVLKVVRATGRAFSGFTIMMDHDQLIMCASHFPHPPSVCSRGHIV